MTRSTEAAVLVFDGDCGFCTSSVHWLLERVRTPVEAIPYQRIELEDYGLTEEGVRRYVWWIDPLGRKYRGHRAVGKALESAGGLWPLVGRSMQTPPLTWLAAAGYRLVARYRGYLPGGTPACRLPPGDGQRPR